MTKLMASLVMGALLALGAPMVPEAGAWQVSARFPGVGILPGGDVLSWLGSPVRLSARFGELVWGSLGAVSQGGDDLAIDSSGNVVVREGCCTMLHVAKLDGATGAVLWDTTPTLSGHPVSAVSVAVDDSGDVIVGGTAYFSGSFVVVKLAGASGLEAWRYVVPGSASRVVVDASGDVLASGTTNLHGTGTDITVVKLAGSTGVELWRTDIDGAAHADDKPSDLAVDPSGAAVVVGRTRNLDDDFSVTRLANADGSILWHRAVATGFATAVALHPGGEIVAAGYIDAASTSSSLAFVRVAPADGSVLWTRLVGRGESADVADVGVDSAGDVFGVGTLLDIHLAARPAAVKLDGADGTLAWLTDLGASGEVPRHAFSVRIDPASDDVVVSTGAGFYSYVTKLDGYTGSHRLLSDGALRCQKTISNAGGKLFTAAVRALERCRDGINAGTVPLADPALCPTVPPTAATLASARATARAKLAGSCTDADVGELVACADTLDGLADPAAGSGCLLTGHPGAAADVLEAAYGRVLAPGEAAERRCQAAVGKGTVKYLSKVLGLLRSCRQNIDKGKITFPPSSCTTDERIARSIGHARLTLLKVVTTSCSDAIVTSIGGCAATINGLVDYNGGSTGCLIDAATSAAGALLIAEHGA